MSFGYLILSNKPCLGLLKIRKQSFSALNLTKDLFIYFRPGWLESREDRITQFGNYITLHCLTSAGYHVLNTLNSPIFFGIFALMHRECDDDAAKRALDQLNSNAFTRVKLLPGLEVHPNQLYEILK